MAEASDRNNRRRKANVSRNPRRNDRKRNARLARCSNDRNRRHNPRRVRCHELIVARNPRNPNAPRVPRSNNQRRRPSELHDQCSSKRRNNVRRRHAKRLRLNSNGRKANVLVVQPNDRNKTPSRNSSRSTKVVHRLSEAAVVVVAKANPASLVSRKRMSSRETRNAA